MYIHESNHASFIVRYMRLKTKLEIFTNFSFERRKYFKLKLQFKRILFAVDYYEFYQSPSFSYFIQWKPLNNQ